MGAIGAVLLLGCSAERLPPPSDAAVSIDAGTMPGDAGAEAPHSEPDAGPVDPLLGLSHPELVRDGYTFLEAPVWRRAGVFQFVDLGTDRLHEVAPDGQQVRTARPRMNGAVGLVEDADGALLVAGHWARRVARAVDGRLPETVVDTFEGRPLNSPNDLALAADGTLYFTDPPFGLQRPADRVLDFHGVFRLAPDGALTAEYRGPLTETPNGCALSPDDRVLYVSDSRAGRLLRFDIGPDGALSAPTPFATTARAADGIAVDAAGNVYAASEAGVEIFAPDGAAFGVLTLPDKPTNLAFGGIDGRTLLITGIEGLYRTRSEIPGRGF